MRIEALTGKRLTGTAALEVAGFTLLLLSYIWGWQGAFPGAMIVIISGGLLWVLASNFLIHGDRPRALGLRVDNLPRSAIEVGAVTVLLALLLAGGGWALGSLRPVGSLTLRRLPWLLFWAFVQQYALQGFILTRLREVLGEGLAAVFTAAAVFALLHLPNPPLTAATFVMGCVWGPLFRRTPNLFTLACSHTILAVVMSHSLSQALMHGMKVGPGYFNF